MIFSCLLSIVAFCLLGFVAAHEGMVDTEHHRDIGAIYTERGYEGDSNYLFQVKDKPECMPLATTIRSVQICQTDVECTFYTGEGCDAGTKNSAVTVGCGDVSSVETPIGNRFQHYICGPSSEHRKSNYTLKTKPHGTKKGEGKVEA